MNQLTVDSRQVTEGDCLVCRKHRGEIEIPGGIIAENDLLFVSHMLIPKKRDRVYLGALLIEPKRHAAAYEDLHDEEAKAIGLTTSRVARALKATTHAEHIYVYRLGHHVDHLHAWVVPRYPGTPREYWGLKVDEWPQAPMGGEVEIAELCEQVRRELATN